LPKKTQYNVNFLVSSRKLLIDKSQEPDGSGGANSNAGCSQPEVVKNNKPLNNGKVNHQQFKAVLRNRCLLDPWIRVPEWKKTGSGMEKNPRAKKKVEDTLNSLMRSQIRDPESF
jgi:hypothetical protein